MLAPGPPIRIQSLSMPTRALARPCLAAALLLLLSAPAAAQVPSPVLEGPIEGAPFVAGTSFDVGLLGYVQEEYFVSGTASSFTSAEPLTADGFWTVTPDETAEYKTRILVIRPAKRRKFNGSVVVEWLNVSGGLDAAPDWVAMHTELMRAGYAWVGVSAQIVGVEGGEPLLGVVSIPLKTANPERYGSLSHPGDSFSYDIFSQVAQAIREPSGASPLGDLRVKRLIAVGDSQSAFRMVTYVNAVQPLARLYDGFLIHSRGGGGASLAEAPQTPVGVPAPTLIRTDQPEPVLTFQTETDMTVLGYFPARQPDSRRFRLWEAAGTAHADTYTLEVGANDLGSSPEAAAILVTSNPLGLFECEAPVNSGPQHFVAKAAIRALDRWVRRGKPPRPAPRLETTPGPTLAIARDAHGNALGGIRTPYVDAPIATLSGEPAGGGLACLIFGSTTPFESALLAELYPRPRDYVRAVKRSARKAVRARHLRPRDAKLIVEAAKQTDLGL